MTALIGPLFFFGFIAVLFLHFWRNARRHEAIEAARIKQQKEEQARRDADYVAHHSHKHTTAPVPKKSQSVATPRKATTGTIRRSNLPIQRSVQPAPTPAPVPAPAPVVIHEDNSLTSVIAGVALGFAFEHLRNGNDDRPVSCAAGAAPFESGGGGDFSGGGASADFDTPSSSNDE